MNTARRQIELQDNEGQRFTLEELCDRTQLSLKTITKVLDAKTTVDRQTLEAFFCAFSLTLDRTDYQFPDTADKAPTIPLVSPLPHPPTTSWGEAIDVSHFYGRQKELEALEQWILLDHCRLIALLGMGGMGKTALSIKLAQTVQPHFEFVVWRSLRDAPQLSDVLADILPILSQQQEVKLRPGQTAQISQLMHYLRQHRCLLVLDNAETILQTGQTVSHYLPGYEAYGDLLQQVGEGIHQSCVILTSREKPGEIAVLEGNYLPVRSHALPGLKAPDSQALFQAKGLTGATSDHQQLIDHYRGNPLALQMVATTIRDLFGGSIAEFLQEETVVFSNMRRLLQQQCDRISNLEHQVMTWLAIHREWVTLAQLQADVGTAIPRQQLLEAVDALNRRSLIERGEFGFTQQPVVMEYWVEGLLERVFADLMAGQALPSLCPERSRRANDSPWFHHYPLIQATAKDYIRQSQLRVILTPLAERLKTHLCPQERLGTHLQQVLAQVRTHFGQTPSYSAGNLLNLMHHLALDLTGLDFSGLWIRQAYLVNTPLHQCNFTKATFEQTVFAEPSTYSRAVAFSPDGTILASADFNHLRLWAMPSGRLIRSMPHNTWTWRLAFSPDGTRLASGTTDNVVKIWDVATGHCLKVLAGEAEGCSSIAWSPDGRQLVGSYHNHIRLWDTVTWTLLATLSDHTHRVAFVAIAPVPDAQGRVILASGSHDQTVRLWDLQTQQCLHVLREHANLVWNLAFSADGTILATSSMDGTIRLWTVATGTLKNTLTSHRHIVSAAMFIPNTDILVSSSFDQTLKYWDIHQGTCQHTTVAHRGEVWGVASTQDGRLIASVGNDKAVKLWDGLTKQCVKTICGSSSQVYGVTGAGPGFLVSGGDDELARIWDLRTGQCCQTLAGHDSWVWAVVVHVARQRLATAGGDGKIRIWDLTNHHCLTVLSGHIAPIYGLAFSADGQTLASCGADAGTKLWDLQTGDCLRTFEGHRSWVWDCVLATHQPWLATASNDETVKQWDLQTGDCLNTLTGHRERVWAVAIAPEDDLIVSGSEDYTAKVWDATTGECLKTLKGHTSQVKTVVFDPSGQWLATGSQDCTLKLWNRQGDCLRTFEGHRSAISSLTFLPSMPMDQSASPRPCLVSGSHDETIRLWDITSGDCLQVLRSPRLYEGMTLAQVQGLSAAAIASLQELGARP
ncbi:NB-ARC domain-containing protein [Sodalinema gerasimenkoae]|uniref:WD40 domain-containing protein n=1 Tax=Sodalinema gerasimenkoae TaxID=2862348 RepID=UPI00135C4991|nr:NB-ARC domain-containing protein [Sodalinema gerasimenkoae]